MLSSTKNDCASGSYHPIIGSNIPIKLSGCSTTIVWVCDITVLPTTWVPKDLLTFLLPNSCLFSTLAFLTEIIFSCTVSRVPEDENDSSATVVAKFWLLFWSFTKVKVFIPASNRGWFILLGFGI